MNTTREGGIPMEILTAEDVSAWLDVSQFQVIAMAKRGELPGVVICGRLRFRAEELENWLRERPRPSPMMKLKV